MFHWTDGVTRRLVAVRQAWYLEVDGDSLRRNRNANIVSGRERSFSVTDVLDNDPVADEFVSWRQPAPKRGQYST
jgi:hypothetical protein